MKPAKLESLQSLEEASAITAEQRVDGQRIFQGEVEDKWFLNALSMAAVEPQVFAQLNCLDAGTFHELQEYGLYIFRFRK